MKKVNDLLKKYDKKFFRDYRSYENKLLGAYKRSLDEVRLIIANMYEKFGTPTITELRKYDRLINIEKELAKAIGKLSGVIINTTTSDIKKFYKGSYYATAYSVEVGTGVNLGFSLLSDEAVRFAAEDTMWADLLKKHNNVLYTDLKFELENTLRQNARQEVVAGLTQGKSYPQISKAIKERFDITAGRAKRVTYTEMHKANSKGRLESIKKAQDSAGRLGIDMYKVWKHNPQGKEPRTDHVSMDGKRADENGVFTLPDGTTTEAPGLTGVAKHDIFCFCSTESEIEGLDNVTPDPELQSMSYNEWENSL